MRVLLVGMCLGLFGLTAWSQDANANAVRCRAAAQLSLPHTTVNSAQVIQAGRLPRPDEDKNDPDQKPDPIYQKMPGICRVIAEAHPTQDSNIKIEVWLPIEKWNGRFIGIGNGGFAGNIYYHEMAHAVLHGYAVGSTDTGHTGSGIDASWALGHPEKVADFGYRGVHEMSLTGPAVVKAIYGKAAEHRYFDGCSDGGREALMEAQRFPDDYDGILAGAPAYNWTHLVSSGVHAFHALMEDPASYIPASKLQAISDAVLAQCGQGGTYLEDPQSCHFDPESLVCKAAETDKCLTQPQAATLKALYAGTRTKDGALVDYGLMPGAELGPNGWKSWITGSDRGKSAGMAFLYGYFGDMVYSKKDVDFKQLQVDEALKAAVERTASDLDAVNPDLSAFSGHGGKLILYHGWDDPAIPALGTVDYFNSMVAKGGEAKAAEFARLYLVPGMQHCDGGPGPTTLGQAGPYDEVSLNDPQHNLYLSLEAWVEKGTAPEQVITQKLEEQGGKSVVTMSRPLCPYPEQSRYTGTGDRNGAASYVCTAAK